MKPVSQCFYVDQESPSGYLVFLSMVLLTALATLTRSGNKPEHGFYVLVLIVAVCAVLVFNKAKCVVRTASDRMEIEVTRIAFRLPSGTKTFLWRELVAYSYNHHRKSSPDLKVEWAYNQSQVFSGTDLVGLYDYLRAFFPNKERGAG